MKKTLCLLLISNLLCQLSFSQHSSDTAYSVEFIGWTGIVTKTFVHNNEKVSIKKTVFVDRRIPIISAMNFITNRTKGPVGIFAYIPAFTLQVRYRGVVLREEGEKIVPVLIYTSSGEQSTIVICFIFAVLFGLLLSRLLCGSKPEWVKCKIFTTIFVVAMIFAHIAQLLIMGSFSKIIDPTAGEWVSMYTCYFLYAQLLYIVWVGIEKFFGKIKTRNIVLAQ